MDLAACFSPCFELVDAALAGGSAAGEDIRAEAARRLERGVIAASAEYTPTAMLAARRIVSLWMGDRLGGCEWAGRGDWNAASPQPRDACAAEALFDVAGRLNAESDEDGQVAMLLLECLRRGFSLDGARRDELLSLLAARFGQ